MARKVNRAAGAALSAFVGGVTLVKVPLWVVYQGLPLGLASIVSKRARRAFAASFDEHIGHPLFHDVPAGFGGKVLDEWEGWGGWSRLRDVLWPEGHPARPADPSPEDTKAKRVARPNWSGVPDLYAALEIGRDATLDEVQAAYRKLAKLYHPDISGSTDSHARFILIDKAYKVLRDPELRWRYDDLRSA